MQKGFEKRFNRGDIVYWCDKSSGKYEVKWGMVDEQFSDAIYIDFLEQKENRYIDGIPIENFYKYQNKQKYKKLPQGWSYDTKLYNLEYRNNPEDKKLFNDLHVSIDNPESLKKAFDAGLLVKSDTKFHGKIDTDISKDGYKVIAKYPMWEHYLTHTSIRLDRLYLTYQKAKDEVNTNIAELNRQAALSDYDWSVEQIDKTLMGWQYVTDATDAEREAYKTWLISMENVENIETRIFGGNVQWKYERNNKWNNITL